MDSIIGGKPIIILLVLLVKKNPNLQNVASKPAKLAYSTQSRRLISVVATTVTVDTGGPKLKKDQMKQGSLSCSLNPKGDPVKPFGQVLLSQI